MGVAAPQPGRSDGVRRLRVSGLSGVTRFVDEQRYRPDRLVLHNLNGHAIVVKR